MPHPLLHITAVRLLERDENVHPLVSEAVRRRRGLALLGALLSDLPRFGAISKRGGLGQLARGLPGAELRDRLHGRGAVNLGLELMKNEGELGPLARLALGVGYFSHAALDSALHPVVDLLVRKDLELAGGEAEVWHARAELFQMLHLHQRLSGRDPDEDPELWRCTRLEEVDQLDRALFHVATVVARVLGDGPGEEAWRGFVDGLGRYAALVQGKLRKAEGGKEDEDDARSRYVTGCNLEEKFIHAQARAVAWTGRLGLAFEPGELEDLGLTALRTWFPDGSVSGPEDPFTALVPGPEVAAHRDHARQYRAQADAHNAQDHTAVGARAVEAQENTADEVEADPIPEEELPAPAAPPPRPSPDEATGWNLSTGGPADPVTAALADEAPAAGNAVREAMRPAGRVPK
ncbi:MAG: hypothetical protein AB2A00_36445 [Myxococcota bacterium]